MRCSKVMAVLVVGALGAAGCGSDDGDREEAEPAADVAGEREEAVDCDPPRRAEATDDAQTFSFDGEERAYLLALPDGYDGARAHPLVLNFHGFTGNKEGHESSTAMGETGAARGYVVVTPDGSGEPRDWNYFSEEDRADDFGFVDALVGDLSERLCIDPDRIYAAGHSAGSAFTGFLICKEPYRFAAAAMVAAFIPTSCPVDEVAPSAIVFHGTDDPMVPYGGGRVGGGDTQIPGAFDTFDAFADAYRCDQPAVEEEVAEDVETHTLSGCAHGSEVVFYALVGGGHGWPGNRAGEDIGVRPDNPLVQFPATDTILDFFDDHPRVDG